MLSGSMGELVVRDPDEVLSGLLFGFLGTQLLYVASELGIADLMDDEPMTVSTSCHGKLLSAATRA